jgi:hypothetical protein
MNPSGTSGTNRARTSSSSRIRHGAFGVICSPGSSPSRSPPADREERDAELAGSLLDGDEVRFGVRWRGGRDPGALTGCLDAGLGEWQAGAGAVSLAGEDRGDLSVGMVCGEATDQLDRVLTEPTAVRAAGVELDRQLAASAALPRDLDRRLALLSVNGHDDLCDQGAQQLLAVAIGCRVRRPQPREVTCDASQRVTLGLREGVGSGVLDRDQLPALVLDRGQGVFEPSL